MSEDIGEWIDSLPLSRKRKNLARDFADGCMMAEVIHVFYPKLVDLHNYEQGLRVDTKIYNWNTLHQRVFKKLGIPIDHQTITAIANAKPGVIEKFLEQVKIAMTTKKPPRTANSPRAEAKSAPAPPKDLPMTEKDREILIEKIKEADQQQQLIRALEMKSQKLMELMQIKDVKIVRLMARKERQYK
ncbi:Sperm flagellar protein 1 [Tritrichomonas foetus]|uniref:Sperm flagellar protein 1 n=1 Tax=Tritrichomonas foetus TaxID=1144522 RepID=A0A1J4KLJ8_9EUKA|nr:Sperm flagellar protein 1 [Tritrichomonas foetus]|eukprot:OHT10566.1 Sperm flagellar protein 1 [Tritrichomonas foetus]